MIEVVDGSIATDLEQPELREAAERIVAAAGESRDLTEELGTVTLVGEIVDAKCWLGVMKPGRGKPHRACAARCISGGIPPLLMVRKEDGGTLPVLLVGENGEPLNQAVLPYVAEPVEVTGRAERRGGRIVLYTAETSIRRVDF